MRQKPFTKAYVLKVTAKHMRVSLDISIRKTTERIPEFDNNPEAAKELLETLSVLHQMRKQLDEFQAANSEQFK